MGLPTPPIQHFLFSWHVIVGTIELRRVSNGPQFYLSIHRVLDVSNDRWHQLLTEAILLFADLSIFDICRRINDDAPFLAAHFLNTTKQSFLVDEYGDEK